MIPISTSSLEVGKYLISNSAIWFNQEISDIHEVQQFDESGCDRAILAIHYKMSNPQVSTSPSPETRIQHHLASPQSLSPTHPESISCLGPALHVAQAALTHLPHTHLRTHPNHRRGFVSLRQEVRSWEWVAALVIGGAFVKGRGR